MSPWTRQSCYSREGRIVGQWADTRLSMRAAVHIHWKYSTLSEDNWQTEIVVSLSDTVSVSHDLCANYQPNKSECDNYNERSEGRIMKLLRMLTFASRRKDVPIPRNVADCRDVSWHAQSYQHLHLPLGSGTKCRLHESMSTDCKQRQ